MRNGLYQYSYWDAAGNALAAPKLFGIMDGGVAPANPALKTYRGVHMRAIRIPGIRNPGFTAEFYPFDGAMLDGTAGAQTYLRRATTTGYPLLEPAALDAVMAEGEKQRTYLSAKCNTWQLTYSTEDPLRLQMVCLALSDSEDDFSMPAYDAIEPNRGVAAESAVFAAEYALLTLAGADYEITGYTLNGNNTLRPKRDGGTRDDDNPLGPQALVAGDEVISLDVTTRKQLPQSVHLQGSTTPNVSMAATASHKNADGDEIAWSAAGLAFVSGGDDRVSEQDGILEWTYTLELLPNPHLYGSQGLTLAFTAAA